MLVDAILGRQIRSAEGEKEKTKMERTLILTLLGFLINQSRNIYGVMH